MTSHENKEFPLELCLHGIQFDRARMVLPRSLLGYFRGGIDCTKASWAVHLKKSSSQDWIYLEPTEIVENRLE